MQRMNTKMPKNAMHARTESFLSLHVFHFSCACVAYFGFWSALQTCVHCARQVGNQPLYCHSARPVLWEGGDEYVDQCDALYNAKVPAACSTAHWLNRPDYWDGLMLYRSIVGQLSLLSSRIKCRQSLPRMKVIQQLTCLTLGCPNSPAYSTDELLNTPRD